MAVWLVPPEDLLERVRQAGLDPHSGLRAIGYATRMLLPLFMTCDTLDFSHSIGSVNSEWQAIFIYERCPLGQGFTEKAYGLLHEIVPAVLANIRKCPCRDGCPCCVGKPLRPYTTWNVERGEASIPSKASARMILEGLLGDSRDLDTQDTQAATDSDAAGEIRLQQALRRRLERMREPQLFHPIKPKIATGYPQIEKPDELDQADVARRRERRDAFRRDLRKRLAKKIRTGDLSPHAGGAAVPEGMKRRGANLPPTYFPGKPEVTEEIAAEEAGAGATPREEVAENQSIRPPEERESKPPAGTVRLGNSVASRARKIKRKREAQ